MKVRIIKEACSKKKTLSEGIDKDHLRQQGIILLKELGSGMFGVVYEVIADVGEGDKRYALKYVDNQSSGYAREKANYQNIKQFVELANIRQDAEALQLSKILPVIYSVSEHQGNLYIIMEKLIPLAQDEEHLFMSEVSGLAWYYTDKQHQSRGEQLVDYILDRDGDINIDLNDEKMVAIIRALSEAPEYKHLLSNPQKYIEILKSRVNSDANAEVLFKAWLQSGQVDDVRYIAMEELYKLNNKFKDFMNGIGNLIITQFKGTDPNETIMDDKPFIGMIMNSIFTIIFAQKYPQRYMKSADIRPGYHAGTTGYGQSSEIYDDDDTNPNYIKEDKTQYDVGRVPSNPKQDSPSKQTPKKYPFDPFISAVRRLGKDWNIEAKDLHSANVMKRANGQYVIADIGLFNSKALKNIQSGIFESKNRKIKVKII